MNGGLATADSDEALEMSGAVWMAYTRPFDRREWFSLGLGRHDASFYRIWIGFQEIMDDHCPIVASGCSLAFSNVFTVRQPLKISRSHF